MAPRSFYDDFPGLGRTWVAFDGPYNEHLVRGVGGLYLALTVAGLLALWWRRPEPTRMLGAAWVVLGVLHLDYHLGHLAGLAPVDRAGNVVTLGGTVVLGVVLLLSAWAEEVHS